MPAIPQRDRDLFENLFVLELANNHWGRVERGLKIIRDHGRLDGLSIPLARRAGVPGSPGRLC